MPRWRQAVIGGLGALLLALNVWALVHFSQVQPQTPPAAVATTPGQLFTDVTDRTGITFVHQKAQPDSIDVGGGAIVFDYDNDGFPDIYVTSNSGPNALYHNNGNGTVTDVAGRARVADPDSDANGGCAADYDNSGHVSLYVTHHGPNRLFHNNREGTFTDVAVQAGVAGNGVARSMGCAWGDYDGDGLLDLAVVAHMRLTDFNTDRIMFEQDQARVDALAPYLDRVSLYHNNGDGTFIDATDLLGDISGLRAASGVGNVGNVGNLWGTGFQPIWFDYNNDGRPDLYVVNDFGASIQPNVLWRNDGPGPNGIWRFADVSKNSGAGVATLGMGVAVGDFQSDGYLDLFVTNIGDPTLLRNNRNGTFSSVGRDAKTSVGRLGTGFRVSWGAVPLDFDNAGFEDLYLVSGYLGQSEIPQLREQPNVLLRNQGDGTFVDVSVGSGADDPGIGRGAYYLDFNRDGCLDLFIVNLRQPARLLQNACDTGHSWLEISLQGTTSNRDGIGARIEVVAGGIRQVRETAAGSSMMGQNMAGAHFGLGANNVAATIRVRWPSGKVQTLSQVRVNQNLKLVEPA